MNQALKVYQVLTTIFNKAELYWWALNNSGKEYANTLLDMETQEVTADVIRNAMLFRQEHKKRDSSYADSIGYAFAQKHSLLFLTGDKEFRDLPGVEFVK